MILGAPDEALNLGLSERCRQEALLCDFCASRHRAISLSANCEVKKLDVVENLSELFKG
jgi:hypothetical protein